MGAGLMTTLLGAFDAQPHLLVLMLVVFYSLASVMQELHEVAGKAGKEGDALRAAPRSVSKLV